MSEESEFQTDGAAMLKQREAKVVWTRGTDNRLVLEEHRTCRDVVIKKRAQVSRLRGVACVLIQCGKFEFNELVERELMKMLKDGGCMGATRDNVTPGSVGLCNL